MGNSNAPLQPTNQHLLEEWEQKWGNNKELKVKEFIRTLTDSPNLIDALLNKAIFTKTTLNILISGYCRNSIGENVGNGIDIQFIINIVSDYYDMNENKPIPENKKGSEDNNKLNKLMDSRKLIILTELKNEYLFVTKKIAKKAIIQLLNGEIEKIPKYNINKKVFLPIGGMSSWKTCKIIINIMFPLSSL
eukprot:472357_1